MYSLRLSFCVRNFIFYCIPLTSTRGFEHFIYIHSFIHSFLYFLLSVFLPFFIRSLVSFFLPSFLQKFQKTLLLPSSGSRICFLYLYLPFFAFILSSLLSLFLSLLLFSSCSPLSYFLVFIYLSLSVFLPSLMWTHTRTII
jgi:hypothetical protein